VIDERDTGKDRDDCQQEQRADTPHGKTRVTEFGDLVIL
jgi:hypothetical protein